MLYGGLHTNTCTQEFVEQSKETDQRQIFLHRRIVSDWPIATDSEPDFLDQF